MGASSKITVTMILLALVIMNTAPELGSK